MKPRVTMRAALRDPALLGNVLRGDSWFGWRVLLIAAAGERLTDEERLEFKRLTNREHEPGVMIKEFVAIFGRRAGKSLAMACFMVWIAAMCDHRSVLKAPGEVGVALCLSRDQKVAKVILQYIDGILRQSKMLRSLIVNRTADLIVLKNRVTCEVRPCSSKVLRGPTYICIVCDEVAFWHTATELANPDVEIITSLRPALLTTKGPLLLASSVYAKTGVLFDSYRRYFGPNGPADILVGYGTSRDLNPSLPQSEIDRELERDYGRNAAEYLSQWRDDVEGFISREIVEACVSNYRELSPEPATTYHMFIDAASGVKDGDSYAAAIAHRAGDLIIIDALREVRAPFSPAAAVADTIIPLARSYRIHRIWGDNFAGQFPQEPIRLAGFSYERVQPHKSELYRDPMLPLLNSQKLVLPRHERAISQICSLERSTRRTGRDEITHPIHGMDDVANCIAGAAYLTYSRIGRYDTSYAGWDDTPAADGTDRNSQNFRDQLLGYCNNMVNSGGGGWGGGGRWR